MTTAEIKKALGADNYNYYGVRGDNYAVEVGQQMPNSQHETDELDGQDAGGTCCIELVGIGHWSDEEDIEDALLDAQVIAGGYDYSHWSIIGGDECEYGNDYGEIVIKNAVAVINLL
jgi:hypothetical protein